MKATWLNRRVVEKIESYFYKHRQLKKKNDCGQGMEGPTQWRSRQRRIGRIPQPLRKSNIMVSGGFEYPSFSPRKKKGCGKAV